MTGPKYRFGEPIDDASVERRWGDDDVEVTRVDARTVHLKSDALADLPL